MLMRIMSQIPWFWHIWRHLTSMSMMSSDMEEPHVHLRNCLNMSFTWGPLLLPWWIIEPKPRERKKQHQNQALHQLIEEEGTLVLMNVVLQFLGWVVPFKMGVVGGVIVWEWCDFRIMFLYWFCICNKYYSISNSKSWIICTSYLHLS